MFNSDHKRVIFQAIPGVIFCLVFTIIAYRFFPFKLQSLFSILDRLVFTIRCEFFSALMLFLGICTVGNIRFFTDAIDGSRNNKKVEIHLRYLQNTLDQFILLFTGHLILCSYLTEHQMKLIPILVMLFIIGRITFWIGYLKTPTARAFGFGTTSYPTVAVFVYDLYHLISSVLK